MGFPPYLIGIGIPLLVGLLGLSYFIFNQERPQKRYEYQGYDYGYDSPRTSYERDNEEVCPICLEDIASSTSKQLPCQHRLHTHCLAELRKRNHNATCPQCRAGI